MDSGKILIGTAGWSYKDWEGIVYPANLRRTQHPVEYMAQYFDLIETNTSFYGHIKPEQGKLWSQKAAASDPDFVFTAKLNRAFPPSPIAAWRAPPSAPIPPPSEDASLATPAPLSIATQR